MWKEGIFRHVYDQFYSAAKTSLFTPAS